MAQLTLLTEDYVKAWGLVPMMLDALVLGNPPVVAHNYGHLAVVSRSLIVAGRNPETAAVFDRPLNRERWPEGKHYDINAYTKAGMSAREKKSTRLIVRDGDLQPGDFCWPGGIWKATAYGGIGIGFSGMAAEEDEVVSRLFLALAIMFAYKDAKRNPTSEPEDSFFGGKMPIWAETIVREASA